MMMLTLVVAFHGSLSVINDILHCDGDDDVDDGDKCVFLQSLELPLIFSVSAFLTILQLQTSLAGTRTVKSAKFI